MSYVRDMTDEDWYAVAWAIVLADPGDDDLQRLLELIPTEVLLRRMDLVDQALAEITPDVIAAHLDRALRAAGLSRPEGGG